MDKKIYKSDEQPLFATAVFLQYLQTYIFYKS